MNKTEIQYHADFDQHELVEFCQNDRLTAMIAVHNSNLGPAVGGCRMYPYATEQDALKDVLRLSRGMTYKSALAGLPLGGGKSVIIGDPRVDKTRDLLLAMGEFVDSLGGRYITAEDSGTSVADMAIMAERTKYVSGVLAEDQYGGDPSPYTAYGVLVGIREAVRHRCNTDLKGIRIAVQGAGNVGYHLTRMLLEDGAKVLVADVSEANLNRAAALGAEVISVKDVLKAEVDVLAPCAMGGVINEDSVRDIRAGIVAGAANNQLATRDMGQVLFDRGILYAPDYVINAGGIIDVFFQQRGEHSRDKVVAHVDKIGETLGNIFRESDLARTGTHEVADSMAEAVFMPAAREVA
jgi:leucine dehydrogenase